MTENQKALRELMRNNPQIKTYAKLAAFWGLSLHTVCAYLKPQSSNSHKKIPEKRMSQLKKILSKSKPSNFGNLPREKMISEHARLSERLDLACRLLNSQGEIIEQQRKELAQSKHEIEQLKAIKDELNKMEC
jgi:small-conductance mechanosensitive channel